jgi:hypothetical protein
LTRRELIDDCAKLIGAQWYTDVLADHKIVRDYEVTQVLVAGRDRGTIRRAIGPRVLHPVVSATTGFSGTVSCFIQLSEKAHYLIFQIIEREDEEYHH